MKCCTRCLHIKKKVVPSRELDAYIRSGVITEEERDALMERRMEKANKTRVSGKLKRHQVHQAESWTPIKRQVEHLYDRTRGVARSGKTNGDGRALWGEDAMQFVSEIKRLYYNARSMGTKPKEIVDWTDLMTEYLQEKRRELIQGWVWDYDCPLTRRE